MTAMFKIAASLEETFHRAVESSSKAVVLMCNVPAVLACTVPEFTKNLAPH